MCLSTLHLTINLINKKKKKPSSSCIIYSINNAPKGASRFIVYLQSTVHPLNITAIYTLSSTLFKRLYTFNVSGFYLFLQDRMENTFGTSFSGVAPVSKGEFSTYINTFTGG